MRHTQESLISSLAAFLVLFTALLSPMVSVLLSAGFLIGFGVVRYMQSDAKRSSKRLLGIVIGILFIVILFSSVFVAIVSKLPRKNLGKGTDMNTRSSSSALVTQKNTFDQLLEECLVKSDRESKKICESLLASITDYDRCVTAGFIVQESSPPRCVLPNGKTFTGMTTGVVSLTGTAACLPPKNTTGPVTLECALGIRTEEGKFYALDTSALPQMQQQSLQQAKKMRVTGTLTPIEAISSLQWDKYEVWGIMKVTGLEKLP